MNWIQSEVFQTIVRRLLTTAATVLVAHGAIKGGKKGSSWKWVWGLPFGSPPGVVAYLKSRQHQAVNTYAAQTPSPTPPAAQPTNIIGLPKTPNGLP